MENKITYEAPAVSITYFEEPVLLDESNKIDLPYDTWAVE